MSQLKYWDGTAWVDAVIGAQGTTGAQGANGSNGTQGLTGTQGIQGSIGSGASAATPTAQGIVYGRSVTDTGTGTNYGFTSLGYQALQDTNASNNARSVVVGYQASPSGQDNVSLGYKSLYKANFNSYENVALGSYTLYESVDGVDNVAIGYNAATSVTSGWANVSVGAYSSRYLSTGQENTAIGYFALYYNTGSGNTAIGRNAGQNTGTGSNVTCVGRDANPSSTSVSNEITLGNSSVTTLRCNVTSITSLSDARDKTDIAPISVGLDFVNQLNPVSFTWNYRQPAEPELDKDGNAIIEGRVGVPDMGFIAQDLMALEDETGLADTLKLTMRENPDRLEATQGRLIPILVKAIQELSAEVAALKAQNPSV